MRLQLYTKVDVEKPYSGWRWRREFLAHGRCMVFARRRHRAVPELNKPLEDFHAGDEDPSPLVRILLSRFLAQFFPLGRTSKLRNDILMFQQHQGEYLSEAWTRLKDLLQKAPHYGIDIWLQVQIFYDRVNPATRRTTYQSAGDFAKPIRADSLPQDVSSTSDLRLIELENQVQRLTEAHLAPKSPIQVNKIASSCEICSGPMTLNIA
ncbi:MAK10-like protein [Tanacetum coccineum]